MPAFYTSRRRDREYEVTAAEGFMIRALRLAAGGSPICTTARGRGRV
jgi:hypothetical protein